MTQPRIVVVGSSNTDLVIQADHLPSPGETVLGGDLITAHGGKGANQAVAAARLGAQVSFVGCVGGDAFGHQARKNLEREGLELEFLVEDTQAPSGVALIVVDPQGENIITVAPGANQRLEAEHVHAAASKVEQADVMLLQLEIPMRTVLAAARVGRSAGAIVIVNPAPAVPLDEELYELMDIMTPNQTEAAQLSGSTTPEQASDSLLERGVKSVVLTLGSAGAFVAEKDGSREMIAGFKVPVVDATAAGDGFNAGLAVALGRGAELKHAVRFAHAVAALTVTRLGAQPSLPNAAEVESFLERHSQT